MEQEKLTDVTNTCPECSSNNIDKEPTETVCRDCGLVIQDTSYYVAGVRIVLDGGLRI